MKNMISEWCLFCEEKAQFEDGYFYTLFMDNIQEESVLEIYKYFPNADRLSAKMISYLLEDHLAFKTQDVGELKQMLSQDFINRMPILKKIPSFAQLVKNPNFDYVKDVNIVDELMFDDILSQDFQDYISDTINLEDKKLYELYNALWGLTTDFDLRNYLFEPLFEFDYDMSSIYRFLRSGGVYTFTKTETLFSIRS